MQELALFFVDASLCLRAGVDRSQLGVSIYWLNVSKGDTIDGASSYLVYGKPFPVILWYGMVLLRWTVLLIILLGAFAPTLASSPSNRNLAESLLQPASVPLRGRCGAPTHGVPSQSFATTAEYHAYWLMPIDSAIGQPQHNDHFVSRSFTADAFTQRLVNQDVNPIDVASVARVNLTAQKIRNGGWILHEGNDEGLTPINEATFMKQEQRNQSKTKWNSGGNDSSS